MSTLEDLEHRVALLEAASIRHSAGQMADHTRTLAEHGELLREIVRLLRPGRRTGPPKANS